MTEAELDAEHHHAYDYKYLFSTNTTNYIMVYVSDVQYDPNRIDARAALLQCCPFCIPATSLLSL